MTTKQLTPTISWWIQVPGGPAFSHVISLASQLPNAPQPAAPISSWQQYKEHWFVLKGDNLSTRLNTSSLTMTRQCVGDFACLEKDCNALVNTAVWRPQFKADNLLNDTLWKQGPFPGGTTGFYFEDASRPDIVKVFFEVGTGVDQDKITRITWLTTTKYQSQTVDLSLTRKAPPKPWPSNWWYYSAP